MMFLDFYTCKNGKCYREKEAGRMKLEWEDR